MDSMMEGRGDPPLKATEVVMKRRRSVASRKPRSTEQLASEYNGILYGQSHSSSHDDDAGIEAGGHRRKELYLNRPEMKESTSHRSDVSRKLMKDDRGGDYDSHTRSSRSNDASKRDSVGVLAMECTARDSGSSDIPLLIPRDGNIPGENRLRKLKLKVKMKEAVDGGTHATLDGTSHQHKHKTMNNLKLGDEDGFNEEETEMDEDFRLMEADSPSDAKVEIPGLTTRQRALKGRGGNGESLIEFPDGLPTTSSRKQKEKLSEVEIQARKAEAAQRRKMQVEKAEKEQQAGAMRKILGIDLEKKKEEKKQKERREKEKQARLEEYRKNCIQTVIGPSGTTITFPESMGFPSIFNSKPVSYPPPREKCAGPWCTNPYKYRDSKTRLPLCSLACYKAGCPGE